MTDANSKKAELLQLLEPIQAFLGELDLSATAVAKEALDERFPLETLSDLRELVREGVLDGWLAERENEGVRFGRLQKPGQNPRSIDLVHMDGAGPGHEHPSGEIDLCFAVTEGALFDGNPEGWTVYGPGSWHVPTVSEGTMDILYFLPGGEIRFGPKEA